jgi:bifunctional DNase/RNase
MLREKTGSRYLPIWIGQFEADAILIFTQKVSVSRPLTHDFALTLVNQLDGATANMT